MRPRALATAIAVTGAMLATASAPAAPARVSFTDIEQQVMCVSCNVPLNIAESPQADRQRALIRDLIARGLRERQIKDRLVAQYGRNVLALPEKSGFGLAAYLVPGAVAAALLALLALMLPRWRRRGDRTTGESTSNLNPDDARRLDADLARYEL